MSDSYQIVLPKKVIDYLTDQITEGSTIIPTSCGDGLMWIIKPAELTDFIVLVQWYEGQDDFSLVNLCDKAFNVLNREMNR